MIECQACYGLRKIASLFKNFNSAKKISVSKKKGMHFTVS
jgi:hypothetical protein